MHEEYETLPYPPLPLHTFLAPCQKSPEYFFLALYDMIPYDMRSSGDSMS